MRSEELMRFLILVVTGAAACVSRPPERSAPPGVVQRCLGDSSAEILAAFVTDLVTRDDFYGPVYRRPWKLPRMDATHVVIVFEEATCRRAGEAYNRSVGQTKLDIRVAVVRAGPYHVVTVPVPDDKRGVAIVFSDSTFSQELSRVGF